MAIRIAQFLVHLYSDKRPGFTQLKADYKTALDTVANSLIILRYLLNMVKHP